VASDSSCGGTRTRSGSAPPEPTSTTSTAWAISLGWSSRLSTRAFTTTTASSASLWPCSVIVRGKTITSTELRRSSSTKTAMRSPFFVHLRWSPVMTPPTAFSAPSSHSARSSSAQSARRDNVASAPSNGWSLT
jgi:hypothetical protein